MDGGKGEPGAARRQTCRAAAPAWPPARRRPIARDRGEAQVEEAAARRRIVPTCPRPVDTTTPALIIQRRRRRFSLSYVLCYTHPKENPPLRWQNREAGFHMIVALARRYHYRTPRFQRQAAPCAVCAQSLVRP